MQREPLDQIAHSSDAVFAIDRASRIIVWNTPCEELLGYRTNDVLGKFCFDVLCGRDTHGNRQCYVNCSVVHHIRYTPDDALRSFPMSVRSHSGEMKRITLSAFLLNGSDPRYGVIVHVLREHGTSSRLEGHLTTMACASPSSQPHITAEALTVREREILGAIANGFSTDAIANNFCISRITVRNHVRNILQKLGVHTKFAAVAYAYEHDLVTPR
jgi:PAS domain S-box-containing protein